MRDLENNQKWRQKKDDPHSLNPAPNIAMQPTANSVAFMRETPWPIR